MAVSAALEAALLYAARGWRVFPCGEVRGRVQPLVKAWQIKATTDARAIEAWWAQYPDAWVAIATGPGSDILVIDLDEKHGHRGVAAFAALAPDGYEYRGPHVRTASGGEHLYYRTDRDWHNSAGSLGDGIDVRGWHGFVYAPPSGGREWLSLPDAVPEVPEWLAALLDGSSVSSAPDAPQAERSTLTALLSNPPQREGDGRNGWLTQVAGHYAKAYRDKRDLYEWHVQMAVGLMGEPLPWDETRRTLNSVWSMEQRNDRSAPDDAGTGTFRLVSLAGIKLRPVKWVWGEPEATGGRLPVGSLSLLGGREGVGKSTIVWDLAAALTRGVLPGVHFGTPTATVIVATEDSYEHTIAPRLVAARADLNRVYRVEPAAPDGANITLPYDLPALAKLVEESGTTLVVLDPLMSRLGKLDTHIDAQVRIALEPLSAFADESGCAIVGLIHVNKTATFDPLTSLMGSRAFTAVARSVLFTMYDPDADGQRLLAHVKCNLGALLPTLKYTIEEVRVAETDEGTVLASHVKWAGEDPRNGRDLLEAAGAAKASRQASKGDVVGDWLVARLKDAGGSERGFDVKAAAMEAGFTERSLQRAAKQVGVKVSRDTRAGSSALWSLPEESF